MIIAYIFEVNPYENSGIVKKVNDQVNYWKSKGHDVYVFCPWPTPTSTSKKHINGVFLSSKLLHIFSDGFAKNFLNKILCAKRLKRQLIEIKPDILYIRQNTWYPGLTSILKEQNTILELNTVDTIEAKYFSFFKKAIYRFGRKKILKNAKGLISVSPDILKHYTEYHHLKKIVVSNGINLNRVIKVKKADKKKAISLVFVGIKGTAWHGLHKILALAELFPEYSFNIVGPDKSDFNEYPSNVKFHGWVGKNELEKIYQENQFGIGSFANYLVGKETDSTLKVREYLAYGLPVILGHWDVDFKNSEFVLKATDKNHKLIDYNIIRAYLETYKDYIVQNEDLKIIDSKTKEEERLEFFEKISKR